MMKIAYHMVMERGVADCRPLVYYALHCELVGVADQH